MSSSRRASRLWLFFAAWALLWPGTRAAGQEVESAENPPVAGLTLAAERLARSGLVHKDARALVAAAEILVLANQPDPRVETSAEEVPRMVQDVPLDPHALLREATEIASATGDRQSALLALQVATDSVLGLGDAALADSLRTLIPSPKGALRGPVLMEGRSWERDFARKARGAVGGPVRIEGLLLEGRPETVRIEFEGDYRPNGLFVASPNPRVDLDCTLHLDDREIARHRGIDSICRFSWKQREVKEVMVRIEHTGETTDYVLATN